MDTNEIRFGVIGAGNIGKHVIRIGRGFEMKVLATDRHPDNFLAEEMNFKYVSLKELLKKSDIITVHIPYDKSNHHFINRKVLKMMKKGAVFVNTSRGAIADTDALVWAMKTGQLSGVGLDVIEGEEYIKEEKELLQKTKNLAALKQLAEGHELLRMDNVVFTPHIAFYSQEALERIINQTIDHIQSFIRGKPDEKAIVRQ